MTETTESREKNVFLEALRRVPDQRGAFLDSACADDPRLRQRVERLLDSHLRIGAFLETPACLEAIDSARGEPADALIGRTIGRYHVRSVIAAGGMGVVYEAVQEQPRRTVALKVMRPGVASRSALRRFQYEAQILGRLRHPAIAEIFEAGIHTDADRAGPADGIPYFAMEYIPNARPITRHAAEKDLPARDRLALFAEVCDAVHHGHQRGIIHRDLKPANVLVDAAGRPKVIDFGVARATDSDLAVTTQQTNIGHLIGTMQYMSPEQCDADPHDLDVRSDVYSLGVVLYELLCGRPPYDVTGATIFQATQRIKEDAAPRPSSVDRRLRGDLETIMLKAVEKDRARRYQSAAELAEDVRRYLRSEPIAARPPTIRYHVRKFVGKHRAGVAAAAVMVLAVVGGVAAALIGTTRGLVRARAAEAQASAVNRFLEDMLASVDPGADGRDVRVADVLKNAAARLETSFEDQPQVRASLHMTIGNVYLGLALYDDAERQFRAAASVRARRLGPEHEMTMQSLNMLARCLLERGDLAAAEEQAVQNHGTLVARLGDDHATTLVATAILARIRHEQGRWAEAEPLFRDVLERNLRQFGETGSETLHTMNNLARVLKDQGKLDEAERLYRRALELRRRTDGLEHPITLTLAANLALLLMERGDWPGAEPLLRSTLESRRERLGPDHADTLKSMGNLGQLLHDAGRPAEAEPLVREALARTTRVFGEDHAETLWAANNLAIVLRALDKFDEAEPLHRRVLDGRRRLFGDANKWTIISMSNLGGLLVDTDRAAEAEKLFRSALDNSRRLLGEDHPQTLIEYRGLGECLTALGRYDEAEPLLRTAFERLQRRFGVRDARTRNAARSVIKLYDAWSRPTDAEPYRILLSKPVLDDSER